jgi:hypothetical protein
MATHTAQPTAARVPVTRRHRRTLVAGLILLGASIVAVALIIALSSGGTTQPAASPTLVSSPGPNAGPADGTPAAVAQALGSTPSDFGPADGTPSAVQHAFGSTGTPASGISPKVSHLAP